MQYEVVTDSGIEYIKDEMFEDLMIDYYRECRFGPSRLHDEQLNMQLFYMNDEVVSWLVEQRLVEIFAQDIYGTIYEGVEIPEHYSYFFDAQWAAAEVYKERILELNETVHVQVIDEFLLQLKRHRFSYSQEDHEAMTKCAGTTLVGKNAFLFPQQEVW